MVIFKMEDITALFESMRDRMVTNIGRKRNLAVKRCVECGMLFQVWKMYEKRICALCTYEKYEPERKKLHEASKRKGVEFDERLYYANKINIHLELQEKKNRINKAYNVKIINEPKCIRIIS